VDTLPAGVTFVSSSHNAVYDSGANTVTWNLGNLGPRASIPGWVTVKVNADTPNNTVLTNYFDVTWENAHGDPFGPATATADTTVYAHPQLSIEKVGPATAIHNEQFSYNVTIRNIGGTPAFHVALEDSLPSGLSYMGSSPAGTYSTGPPAKVVWDDLGTIQANGARTVTVTVTVTDTVANGTVLTDTAMVIWQNDADEDFGPVADTVDTTIYTLPRLQITKSGPAEAAVGSLITYTGEITNVGGDEASDVVLVDNLPSGVTFVSSSQDAVYDAVSNKVTWNLGSIDPGVTVSGWLTVRISSDLTDGSVLTNVFSVTGKDPLGNPLSEATATANTTVYTHPLLSVQKTGPAQGYRGQSLTYTIQVSNIGETAAVNVTLRDSLPTGLTYESSNPAGSHAGGLVTWNLLTIQSGGVKTVNVTATVDNTVENNTPLTDTAMVTWQNDADEDFGPVADTVDTTIYSFPDHLSPSRDL